MWFNVAPAFNAWGAPPLRQGKLVARQQFRRCGQPSPETVITVGPPVCPGGSGDPGQPLSRRCSRRCSRNSSRVPSLSYQRSFLIRPFLGQSSSRHLGKPPRRSPRNTFDIPPTISSTTAAGEPVRLSARQTLCGLASHRSAYTGFATPGGPYAPPKITEPVMECARRVPVTNAHPASLLRVVYADTGEPMSDHVLATSADQVIRTWFPLQQGRDVAVVQSGCNANGTSAVVNVRSPPVAAAGPANRGAGSAIGPGCSRPGLHPWSSPAPPRRRCAFGAASKRLPRMRSYRLGSPRSRSDRRCGSSRRSVAESSPVEGRSTLVTRGRMTVTTTPATVERGSTVNVTVTATDADTGAPINGAQVLLDGKLVGQTGVAFQFKPVHGSAEPRWSGHGTGCPRRPGVHDHAQGPPPRPKGRLFLNICSNPADPEHAQAGVSDVDRRNPLDTGPDPSPPRVRIHR